MGARLTILVLWLLAPAVYADAEASKKIVRLTWAPYSFLEKGLRSVPWVKDPFFPEVNGFKLSAVISRELAYINGRWMRVGDELEGYVVREIQPSGVTLTKRTEVLTLKMEE